MCTVIAASIVCLYAVVAVSESLDVHVTTTLGDVRGTRTSRDYRLDVMTQTVDIFLGIPYAESPTDKRRFQMTVPKSPWWGTHDGTRIRARCPQRPCDDSPCVGTISEDCLFLNIYSPYETDRSTVAYPVMVYIHGGSYATGSANDYDGHVLAQRGVLVITINYRLGILGFLTTGDAELPGQWGMYDQIEALRWIKQNVHAFRGNASQVTIFGNSAGASSVGLHVLSSHSKGLFQKAIIQSGPPNSFWAVHGDQAALRWFVEETAKRLDCHNHQMKAIIKCMKSLSWQKIVSITYPRITPSATDLKPWIDGDLLPANVTHILRQGPVNVVPILIGTTRDEWARNMGWLLEPLLRQETHLDDDFNDGLNRETFLRSIEYIATERFNWPRDVVETLQYEYTDWTKPDDPVTNREQYIQFFTDLSMTAPTVELAKRLYNHNVPIHMYTFNHAHSIYPNQNRSAEHKPIWSWLETASYHEIELNYVFGAPFHGRTVWYDGNFTADDRKLSDEMMKLWSNFAKYSDPTPDNEDVKWERYHPNTTNYLHIAAGNYQMKQHLRSHHVFLWNYLVPKLVTKFSELDRLRSQRVYDVELWVFVGISGVMTVMTVVLTAILCRITKSEVDFNWSKGSVAV